MRAILTGIAVLGMLASGVFADAAKEFNCRTQLNNKDRATYYEVQVFRDGNHGGLVTVEQSNQDWFHDSLYHVKRSFIQGYARETEEEIVVAQDGGESYLKISKEPLQTVSEPWGVELTEEEYTYKAELLLKKKEGEFYGGGWYWEKFDHGFGANQREEVVEMTCEKSTMIDDDEEKNKAELKQENFEQLNQ